MSPKIDVNVGLLLKYLFAAICMFVVVAWKFDKPDPLLETLDNVISGVMGAAIALMRVGPNTRSSKDEGTK